MKYQILFILLIISLFSCEREYEYATSTDGLYFSVDTLTFDTIFSSMGSITRNFKIYNTNNEDLVINSIELGGGDNSQFNINVNGYAESKVENIKINESDSLYIFVNITIEPEDSNSPFVVSDSITITTGDETSVVHLIAYGQDVVLLSSETLETTTFTSDKPYLIYDYLIVDSLQTLTIDPGAKLYFYDDADMLVYGSLKVNGTSEDPVSFLSYRLEDWYEDKPGQWGSLYFMPESSDNYINYAIIRNGDMGIYVDSVGLGDDVGVTIENTIINNMSEFGIITQNSKVNVNNTVIGDCGYHSVALTLGGTYNFYHCTLGNYFDWPYRTTPALFLNNYYTDDNDENVVIPLVEANFYNSIIYGNNYTELGFDFEESDKYENNGYDYLFQNCLIRSGDVDTNDETKFIDIINGESPNFIDVSEYDFQLDTLSPCKDAGDVTIANQYPYDILETSRINDGGPDIGAYERVEAE